MDCSINGPLDLPQQKKAEVWFEGTGTAQTVYQGQGVCYNSDYGTATASTPARYNRVELPASGNKTHFAGVLESNYTIPATGRLVTILLPGSVCTIRLAAGQSTTIGVTAVECTYTAGTWKTASNAGKGVAIALQTITGSGAVQNCLAVLEEGLPSVGLAD